MKMVKKIKYCRVDNCELDNLLRFKFFVSCYNNIDNATKKKISASEQEMMETLNMNTLAQGNC